MGPLSNPRHEIVAQNKALGLSWEEAMLKAGYAASTARHNLGRMVANVGVQSRAAEIIQQRSEKKLVTAAKLHERWSEMFDADIADIYEPGGKKLKPLMEWPKIWRQMLSGVDTKEIFERSQDGGGSSWDQVGEIVRLKFIAAKDLGELLGRHKAIDAFVQQRPAEAAPQEITINVQVKSLAFALKPDELESIRMRLLEQASEQPKERVQ